MIATRPVDISARPVKSSLSVFSPALAGSSLIASGIAIAPTIRFTKKIQCQFSTWMIVPPSSGPSVGASIIGTATRPITRPIRLGPAASAMMICASGMIMPPPMPCSTRKKISSVSVVARPQSSEPSVKSVREMRKTRLAPKRREAQPVTGITAASESM